MNHQKDIEIVLSHRYDQGADYWTTIDNRISKGSPFSLLESVSYLIDLGMNINDSIVTECANRIFLNWRDNGSFRFSPSGASYPCYTIHAANLLCLLGNKEDKRMQHTIKHILETQQSDGGWRCLKFSYGKGEETDYSNPFPTLLALNVFRMLGHQDKLEQLDKAVEFLLNHWTIKKPIGPCHYGIGTLFMKAEYPFRTYNIFHYVYILSFYKRAREDDRFMEIFKILKSKLVNGSIIVERVPQKMATLSFCMRGKPSKLATEKYQVICNNIEKDIKK